MIKITERMLSEFRTDRLHDPEELKRASDIVKYLVHTNEYPRQIEDYYSKILKIWRELSNEEKAIRMLQDDLLYIEAERGNRLFEIKYYEPHRI